MTSPITQSLGTAVAQVVIPSVSQTRVEGGAQPPTQSQMMQASQAAAQVTTVKPKNDRERAPRVPRHVDGTYSPQRNKRKAAPKEAGRDSPGQENMEEKVDVLA